MQLLERVTHMGLFRGLGLDYDRREVPDVDFEGANAPVEFLKMQLWGNRAGDILRVLRQTGAFPEATTLSKVRVKHWLDRQADDSAFSLSDVKYDGKITARGTSFQAHIGLVSSVARDYQQTIETFENRFSIYLAEVNNGNSILAGEPLTISFNRPISDMDIFLECLFSGTDPFRLSGIPVRVGSRMHRVTAIDLHVSHQITFEITTEFMRLYLPKGSCGNSVARLYTTLQHFYDSMVVLETTDGERVLEA